MKDPIERQDAIDAIKKHEIELSIYAPRETDVFWDDAIDCCVSEIEALPSAQPEKKKGKWIKFDSSEDKYDVIKCPCCKHTFTVDSYHWTDIGFIKDDFKFCPNCGADMRGEE